MITGLDLRLRLYRSLGMPITLKIIFEYLSEPGSFGNLRIREKFFDEGHL